MDVWGISGARACGGTLDTWRCRCTCYAEASRSRDTCHYENFRIDAIHFRPVAC